MTMPYDIVIAQEPWERFWAYVDECPDEVAAFGYVKPDEELGAFFVDEIFLVPQEVCGTEVDFVKDGLPYAVEKAIKDGRIEDLRFCVHSHVNMGTGFSNTDDDMIEKMGSTGTPWFVSAIFNKKGETNGRVDIFPSTLPFDFGPQLSVSAKVMTEHSRTILDDAKAELAKFVTKQKLANPTNGGNKAGTKWQQPTKQTAGTTLVIKDGQYEYKESGPKPGEDWFEDDELERELELWIQARRNSWTDVEDTDGFVHFYDDDGVWKGTAHALDESSVDWFLAKRDMTDSSDEDDAWALIDALEGYDEYEPNRENTP